MAERRNRDSEKPEKEGITADMTRDEAMKMAMDRLENAKDRDGKAKARAKVIATAMDITGSEKGGRDNKTNRLDLKAMDADGDGKLTADEMKKAMTTDKLDPKAKALVEGTVNKMMEGKDDGMSIGEVVKALGDMGVQMTSDTGGPNVPRKGGGDRRR